MAWAPGSRWYRQKITISGTNVAGDVIDFPVAINIPAGNDVFTDATTGGTDILFTEEDGETFLDFERSVWDKSGSEGVFYVKATLSSGSDNDIYMYYGGEDLTDFEDSDNTWDDNFYSVYHFEETSGNAQDSTSNNRAATSTSATRSQASPLGKSYYFNGSSNEVQVYTGNPVANRIPGDTSHTYKELTVAIYCKPGTGNDRGIFCVMQSHHGGGHDRHIYFDSAGNVRHRLWPVETLDTADTDWSNDQWHQIAIAYGQETGENHKIVVDGQTRVTGSASAFSNFDWDERYYIGYSQDPANKYFNGYITEVRISRIYRAVDWLETEYNNILDSANFLNFAAREISPYLITTSPHDHPTVFAVGEFDPIGGVRQILTEYTEGVSSTIYYDMPVYYALTDVVSGTRDVYNELYVATTGTLGDAYLSEYVDLFVASSGDLGSDVRSIVDDFTVGSVPAGVYGGTDVAAEYIQGHIVSPSGTGEDVDVEWVMPAAFNTQIDEDIEFTISTSQLYEYDVDVYSSTYSGTVVYDVVGDPWYDYSWPYRTKITVDNLLVPGNLTNFPLTVQIDTGHNVFINAQNSGNDILFTDDAGIKLDHELSVFDKGNTLLVAYVKTDLSASVDTDIYMYYGNAGASDQSNPTAVWTGYRGVYHFEDTSTSTLTDSTSNNRDGYAVAGITAEAAGIIGKSWEFRGNSGDYVNILQAKGLAVVGGGARTVSCYFYPLENESATPSWAGTIRLGGDSGGGTLFLMAVDNPEASPYCNSHYPPDNAIAFHGYGGSSNVCTGYTLSTLGINDWHSYSVTYGYSVSNRIQVYLDGQPYGFRDYTLNTSDGDVILGGRSSGAVFKFRFGELRVYNGALSPDWMETEHNNIIEMSSFLAFSDEELLYHWELDDYVDSEMATVNSGTGEGGYLWPFPSDIYSTASGSRHPMETDLYVSLANTVPSGQVFKSPEVWPVGSGYYFGGEITTSGALTGYEQDVYVSLESLVSGSNQNTYRTDMRLHALEVDNFFLEVDEYTTSAGVMSVDVYDKRRIPISTSGTYFVVSGTQVPVTFSGIEVSTTDLGQPIVASGYRMFFDSPTDFYADEPLEIVAHGANIIGDIIEQTYYLLYGYNLIYDTPPEIVWGWGDQIIVWATAKNKASCPAQSTDGWWFEVRPKEHADLGATIVPTGYANLPATIYPQLEPNTFFYGAKVKVIVRAKDEAGNEMEPFVLNFTIEDKPN